MIYLLLGDSYDIVNQFKEIRSEDKLESFDLKLDDFDDIRQALQSVSLFSEPTTYKISGLNYKARHPQLQELLEGYSGENSVVLVGPLAKNTKLYKYLAKSAEVRESKPQYTDAWLRDRVKQLNLNIDRKCQELLIDLVGDNRLILDQELSKLSYFDVVDADLINKTVARSASSDVFQLIAEISQGNKQASLEIYDRLLKQKIAPQEIVGILNWQLGVLVSIKLLEKSSDVTAKDLKLSPYVLRKSQKLADRFSYQEVKAIVERLFSADVQMKSSPGGELILRKFIVSLF